MATGGLRKFCTVKNMNWTGEVMHGEFDGTYYVLDDGDCYKPEILATRYDAIFLEDDPRENRDDVRLKLSAGQP